MATPTTPLPDLLSTATALHALGGLQYPIDDLRGTTDMYGRELDVTEVAVVDELASAADLVMGKASGIPAAIVRGFPYRPGDGRVVDLVRPADEDLFR